MMPEHRTTRLGVAQPTFACDIRADETDAAKVAGSVMKNAAHTAELVDVAAGLGVELLCFPEDTGTICGYADRPGRFYLRQSSGAAQRGTRACQSPF